MPQFETIIFFNQVFWLVSGLFVSYTFFLTDFLISTASVLKSRSKKLTTKCT